MPVGLPGLDFLTGDGMRTNRTSFAAAAFALAALSSGCTDQRAATPAEPQLAIAWFGTTTVAPTTASVATGATTQLTGTYRDRRGRLVAGATFKWTSADTNVAKVSSTGLVTGVSAGSVAVTASRSGTKATAQVTVTGTVTPPPPPPPPPPVGTSGRWVSGYYVGYQRGLYPESSIDFSVLTHIFVGAIEPGANATVETHFFIDNVNGPQMARNISTRAHQAGRKAILMLGGDGYRDALLAATTPANMPTFVNNLISTMSSLGYDGIDIDWEPITTADQPIVIDLMRRLRAAQPSIILTIPVAWAPPVNPWYLEVASLVDQMNIMSYGMAANWGGWDSWHQAALVGETSTHPTSIDKSVKMYRAVGVPASKLGIGLGFYGSCWRGVNTMGVPLAAGADVVAGDNTMSYVNIMSSYYSAANYRWDATAKAGYLSFSQNTGPAQCSMVSYEDPASITEKGAYVKANGLGGAIIWTINQGYFPNAAVGARDPLTKAAYSSIVQ